MSGYGLAVGEAALKSAGPITFGPDNILFAADNASAAILAIEVPEGGTAHKAEAFEVENLDSKLAAFLGCDRKDVRIRDLAVHPVTQNVYLSVARGHGAEESGLILRVDRANGALSEVSLRNIPFARAAIENAPRETDHHGADYEFVDGQFVKKEMRAATVTDMAYADGLLLVAGLSNEEFSSNLRRIPFPFRGESSQNSLEIFHVSHGKYETAAPIKSFVPYGGNTSILASYTCTPVVSFSLAGLKSGVQAKGKTVADLGPRNIAIDMVAFHKGDKEYLLVSNSHHPLMKLACEDIDRQEALTTPTEPVGVPRTALDHPGVSRMANLNGSFVLTMQRDQQGATHLRSLSTAAL